MILKVFGGKANDRYENVLPDLKVGEGWRVVTEPLKSVLHPNGFITPDTRITFESYII